MKYLPQAQQMKAADRYTIKTLGVPSMELMERAAGSCVKVMKELNLNLSRVCVVCGSGNNGGDGFAIARLLILDGYKVTVVMAGKNDRCTEECREQIRLFESAGGSFGNEYREEEYSIIVDAIFGVGLSREISGRYLGILDAMNDSKALKFAVDIPSGISADTGRVLGTAFRADYTVTFQAVKFGMEVYPGKEYAGKVIAADIGISEQTLREDMSVVLKPEREDYKRLLPERKADSHKGTYGKVLVIAGSKGMCGAAYFNAKSAYMAGAGLVKIYTAEENRAILQQLLPEAMVAPYEGYDEEELKELIAWADVICMGSGIGTGEDAGRRVRAVLSNGNIPCVIDADGLNLLALHPEYVKRMSHGRYIFTPHMKEMSRLTGVPVKDIKQDPLKALGDYTKTVGAVCVMKDSRTLTGKRGERCVLNTSGNSAMAKAGSGDILAGILAGYLAQGLDCYEAAVLGTYIHGRAGDDAKKIKGCYSVMAEDIISQIGPAMNECAGRMEEKNG